MKVIECGVSEWSEREHGLDYPGPIETTDFKVTGRGHERIRALYRTYCDRKHGVWSGQVRTPPEDRIAAWLCENCAHFVFVQTATARGTVLSFVDPDDAAAFKREFVS